MNAVEIRNLTRRFGEKTAVDNLSMTVPEGAIYGFIGENGSGKSTTEKMLCGLIPSTSGEITIYGKSNKEASVREQIGVLIEAPGCYPEMTVWNNLLCFADVLGIKNKKEEVRNVLRMVRMDGAASNKFRNCSLGMKQRVGIAMALLGNPKLLVLDEPMNGVDADGLRILREILKDLSQKGVTILVSSHLLSELEKIATHYGILRHGKMILEMTAEELDSRCRTFTALKTKENENALALLRSKYSRCECENEEIRIYDEMKESDAVSFLHENHISVTEVSRKKISLEEFYMDLMEEERKNG